MNLANARTLLQKFEFTRLIMAGNSLIGLMHVDDKDMLMSVATRSQMSTV